MIQPREGGENEGEERPPWHWIGFGAVAIFATWLPLAYAAQLVALRATEARFGSNATEAEVSLAIAAMSGAERLRLTASQALPHVLALAIAAFAGGFLVGRFGQKAGPRQAAAAGGVTALAAVLLSCRSGAMSLSAVVILGVATAFAAWGGRTGVRTRAS